MRMVLFLADVTNLIPLTKHLTLHHGQINFKTPSLTALLADAQTLVLRWGKEYGVRYLE